MEVPESCSAGQSVCAGCQSAEEHLGEVEPLRIPDFLNTGRVSEFTEHTFSAEEYVGQKQRLRVESRKASEFTEHDLSANDSETEVMSKAASNVWLDESTPEWTAKSCTSEPVRNIHEAEEPSMADFLRRYDLGSYALKFQGVRLQTLLEMDEDDLIDFYVQASMMKGDRRRFVEALAETRQAMQAGRASGLMAAVRGKDPGRIGSSHDSASGRVVAVPAKSDSWGAVFSSYFSCSCFREKEELSLRESYELSRRQKESPFRQ